MISIIPMGITMGMIKMNKTKTITTGNKQVMRENLPRKK